MTPEALEVEVAKQRQQISALEVGFKELKSGLSLAFKSQARLEGQVMSVRIEVHELNENVSRSNKINLETQGEVHGLRRDTHESFAAVTHSLTAIYNQLIDHTRDVAVMGQPIPSPTPPMLDEEED